MTSPDTCWSPQIAKCTLDFDGNGHQDALTDGVIVMRALFGMTGSAVVTGALGDNPSRGDWNAIRTYLNASCGANFAQ